MKVLGWNYHGICNVMTVRALKAHVKRNSPDIIFFSETKASVYRMKLVLKAITKGIASGIYVMWKSSLSIYQVEYNKNLIALKVSDALCDWLLVSFYDPPYPVKKQKAWENLWPF